MLIEILNVELNMSLFYFMISCLFYSFFFKHLLLTLISLEFMMINISMNLYTNLLMINMNMYFMSIFFTIMICESVLGLSLLIFIIRNNGNDYLKSLNLLK